MRLSILVATLVAVMAVGGCKSKATRSDLGAPRPIATTSGGDDAIAQGANEVSGFDAAQEAERSLSTNLVYFDFDDTVIKSEYQPVIDRFAAYLRNNPAARVRLEGHADERGTREYNIGLGERRAIAVESALLSLGVSREQLSLVSYGEERPVDTEHNEQAWALNRRVQLLRQ